MILRALRAGAWGLAAAIALYDVFYTEHRMMMFEAAPQQTMMGIMCLMDLAALYVTIRAVDRILDFAGQRKGLRLEALPPLDR